MRGLLALSAAVLLAGCTVGPDFAPPQVAAPTRYGETPADVASRLVASPVDARWWDRFGDPELTALVSRLLAQNLDLQQAAERIEQARAAVGIARSGALPNLTGRAQYVRQRLSEKGVSSLIEATPGAPVEFDVYRASVLPSWDLDLFGRIRRQAEAARADADAALEARRGLLIAAVADLAQSYMQLRLAQAQQQVLARNLALAERRRALVRNRFANGVATTLEVAQADAQGLAIAEDLPSLRTTEARLVNALGLLLAEPPRTLGAELARPATQPLVPPEVPVGLPADLARRRPDIREAEARLHAATATTGAAVASFYPDVTLGSTFSFESLSLGSLLTGGARQFMLGPTLDLPLFEGGRLSSTLHLREAQQRESALRFRQTVLQAWHEVDDAMVGYAEAQHRRVAAAQTRDADVRALTAADQQYAQGVTSLLDVIAAQEGLLRGELSVASSQADLQQRLVDLYRALGGGWSAEKAG